MRPSIDERLARFTPNELVELLARCESSDRLEICGALLIHIGRRAKFQELTQDKVAELLGYVDILAYGDEKGVDEVRTFCLMNFRAE